MIDTIIAGDTLKIDYSNGDFPSATYDIWIALRGNALTPIDIKTGVTGVTITKPASGFSVTVTAAATAAYPPGAYKYALYMTKAGERYQVETGTIVVKPDLSALTVSGDARSHVKKVLDAIEAVLENRASQDQMSYSIAGRALSRMPVADLLMLRDRYRAEYQMELKAEKIAMGLGGNNQVRVRF